MSQQKASHLNDRERAIYKNEVHPTAPKHAVILSGGGANGAYEVGVLKALFAGQSPTTGYQPLEPDILTGTSVGSYNAAFLTAYWDQSGRASIDHLEQIWLDKIADRLGQASNSAYRIRCNPVDVVNPLNYIPNPFQPFSQFFKDATSMTWDGVQRIVNLAMAENTPMLDRIVNLFNFSSLISNQPYRSLIDETIHFESVRLSSRTLKIAATNWAMGEVEVFNNRDLSDWAGASILMASSAIPGVFPIQTVGSQSYVDGGVLMNTPMRLAIDAGADVLHLITLNPEVDKIALSNMSNTLTTLWRHQVINWVKAVEKGFLSVWSTNRTIEIAEFAMTHMTPNQPDDLPDSEASAYASQFLSELEKEIKHYRPLTVFLYRPSDDLGGSLGLLNFNRNRIQELIERGVTDARDFQRTPDNYIDPRPLNYHRLSS